MIRHSTHSELEIRNGIRSGSIVLAGNLRDKIYGTLHCTSGKRMKKINRVFFASAQQALQQGFRPCGHCLRDAYSLWKKNVI